MNRKFEFGIVLQHTFQTFEAGHIHLADDAQLIFIDNLRCKTIVGGDAGKRIFLVVDDTTEHFGTLSDKRIDRLVGNRDTQRKRIDKHTKAFGDAHITSSVANRREVNVVVARVACYGIEGSSQHHRSRRDTQLLGITADSLHIER